MQNSYLNAYNIGEKEAKDRLFEKLNSFKARDTTPHLTRWKFGAECGEVKADLIREFRTKHEQNSDCYPAQWCTTPFLERVLHDFTKFTSNFDGDESINFFVRDELLTIREAYDGAFDASKLLTNGLYRDSVYWSNDLVARWLGSNRYLETKAQRDINEFVEEVKGPLPTPKASPSAPKLASAPVTNQASINTASPKQAVALLMSLLHEVLKEGVQTVNADATVRLVHFLTGKSMGNIDNEVKAWKKNEFADYKGNLETVLRHLDDLETGLEFKDLKHAIDRGHNRKANPKAK